MFSLPEIKKNKLMRGIGQIMFVTGIMLILASLVFYPDEKIESYNGYFSFLFFAGGIIVIISLLFNLVGLNLKKTGK